MKSILKLSGIYDDKTLSSLKDKGIFDFGFDLRPKSFNFLQEHKLLEILENNYSPMNKYFLHFCHEVDFVIKKFLEDIEKVINRCDPGFGPNDRFSLEFSDERDCKFYDSFKINYLVHYYEGLKLETLEQSKYCKGLVLSYDYLFSLYESEQFLYFLSKLLPPLKDRLNDNDFVIILNINWDSDIFPSLFDYLKIHYYSLNINQLVENSYRQINIDRLVHGINHFASLR